MVVLLESVAERREEERCCCCCKQEEWKRQKGSQNMLPWESDPSLGEPLYTEMVVMVMVVFFDFIQLEKG